jgi:hypothetical protein
LATGEFPFFAPKHCDARIGAVGMALAGSGTMTAEELEILQKAYHEALIKYEAIAVSLSRHLIAGTQPSSEELELEHYARLALDAARQRYLEAWKQRS